MINFTVLREERAPISKGSCPVDKMAELASYRRNSNHVIPPYCYRWTLAALNSMSVFPVEKDIRWIPVDSEHGSLVLVKVVWLPSNDTMDLYTSDGGETFMVLRSHTEEIEFELEEGERYVRYTIDVEYPQGGTL